MQGLIYVCLAFGGLAAIAWYGAAPPRQTRQQKRAYGLLAVGAWLLALVLANTVL